MIPISVDAAERIRMARGGAAAEADEFRDVTMDQIVGWATSGRYHHVSARITPEVAGQMLEWNRNNRPIRGVKRLRHLTAEMAEGRWIDRSGGVISITTECDLDNGQHRLHACIAAGVPFTAILVFGNDKKAYQVIDKHSKRTDSDTLARAGEINTTCLAASLGLLAIVEDGGTTERSATGAERAALLERHPLIRESVRTCHMTKRLRPYGSPAVFATAHYLMVASGWSSKIVDEFFSSAVIGAGQGEEDPRLKWRNRLLSIKGTKDRMMVYALTVKAFNAWAGGSPIRILSWKPAVEPLPRPIDGPEATGRARQDVRGVR